MKNDGKMIIQDVISAAEILHKEKVDSLEAVCIELDDNLKSSEENVRTLQEDVSRVTAEYEHVKERLMAIEINHGIIISPNL